MPRKLTELTPADIEDIAGLVIQFGYTQKEVAEAYRVNPGVVSTIVQRRRYQDLQWQEDMNNLSLAVAGDKNHGIL